MEGSEFAEKRIRVAYLAVSTDLRKDSLVVCNFVPVDMPHAAHAFLEGLGQLIRRGTGERRKAEHLYDHLANLPWTISRSIV